MALSAEEVAKIAKLSRLNITPDEAQSYAKDLSAILEYVNQLSAVDVSTVEAMTHVHGSKNVFRADQAEESMPVKEVLSNAPDVSGQFIRVPLVVEHNTEH